MIEVDCATALADALSKLTLAEYSLGATTVVRRMLDGTDPNLAVGIFLQSWAPVDRPNIGGHEPAIARYRFYIQTFIKSTVREDGELWAMTLAKKVRNMIYTDPSLRTALEQLRETDEVRIERTIRYGVEAAEFTDAAITGGLAFFSQTQFWLETEVV